jgi:hypothetical protein
MDDLVALRQQSMNDFVVSGGAKKTPSFCEAQRAATFIRDPALLTHPFYAACMTNSNVPKKNIETSITELCSSKLGLCEVTLEGSKNRINRVSRYGVNNIAFDSMGALCSVSSSNGVIRVYEFDECSAHLYDKG